MNYFAFFLVTSDNHSFTMELGFGDNGGDYHHRIQEEEEEDIVVLSGGSNDGVFQPLKCSSAILIGSTSTGMMAVWIAPVVLACL